jgi:hypothetical protein
MGCVEGAVPIKRLNFIPSSLPLVEPNGYQPRVLIEAHGYGGKIGEVVCDLDESPDPGPRGPRQHD